MALCSPSSGTDPRRLTPNRRFRTSYAYRTNIGEAIVDDLPALRQALANEEAAMNARKGVINRLKGKIAELEGVARHQEGTSTDRLDALRAELLRIRSIDDWEQQRAAIASAPRELAAVYNAAWAELTQFKKNLGAVAADVLPLLRERLLAHDSRSKAKWNMLEERERCVSTGAGHHHSRSES